MRKILLFGGAFDMPTIAHRDIMIAARTLPFDAIWMQPCYSHMFGKSMTSGNLRLQMCRRIAVKSLMPWISDFEIVRKLKLPTYSILIEMKKAFPQCEFSLLVGSDHVRKIQEWIDYEKLISEFEIVISQRVGCEFEMLNNELHCLTDNKVISLPFKKLTIVKNNISEEISSTNVKSLIQSGDIEKAKSYVPEGVWDVIVKNKLYGIK